MFFTKYPHRANFSYAADFDEATGRFRAGIREFTATLEAFEGDVYRVRVANPELWEDNRCLVPLSPPPASPRRRLAFEDGFSLCLRGKEGLPILRSVPGEAFGVMGDSSLWQFAVSEDATFHGMGEKTFGVFELSGVRARFYNTDMWADFHDAQCQEHPTDPSYCSVPYLVVRTGGEFVGLLLHNPFPASIQTPGTDHTRAFAEWRETGRNVLMGNEGGQPDLWVLYGPTLAELTRKLQTLVGGVPLPPIWSLGYQQSRWGYEGHDDLVKMDAEFARHKVPCDGLWMDLEHMRGYRIFNTNPEAFPHGVRATADILAKNGRRIVPILDPGVKYEPGLPVYDDGHEKRIFCLNPEGGEYVGIVWPGDTVFPDFTLPEGRAWWAAYAKSFFEEGFGATWVDMNDPSTGTVDPDGMLFNRGTEPHAMHRNQYALGMQMATWDGMVAARPDERPFMLTRSGFVGTGRYSAVWTGDNVSNWFYLRNSIPAALGMSLSGLPFSGPDVGGFGGDCTDRLMVEWVKACFLFPFFRNHSGKGSRHQEPFAFPPKAMRTIRRYIRLRYKLIPYLYGLFADLEATGTPPLRPLLYEFDQPGLERIDDQFMVGPWILQAPFVDEHAKTRELTLPGDDLWFDARDGKWIGPGIVEAKRKQDETPLFVRAGALIPTQPGTPTDAKKDLNHVHVHVFVPDGWSGESETTLVADDGVGYGYQKGERTEVRIRLAAAEGNVAILRETSHAGFGPIETVFVFHGAYESVRIDGRMPKLVEGKAVLAGRPLPVHIAEL